MSEPSDLDDVVAAWRDQPVEPRAFGVLEIRRAVSRIETEARNAVVVVAIGTLFMMSLWIVLAVLADNALARAGAILTAVVYGGNAALVIYRRRQLAAACMSASELPSIEYYRMLSDIDRRIRLPGGGWLLHVGMIAPPLIYFAGAAIAEPKSWPAMAAVAFIYAGFYAALVPWARRNGLATYDEMERYKESRGVL